ncbi:F0F1 ATP synthase subunit B [Amycolatopsis acidiphila]|nr:F0F1 ATP synthase subunit B [Amycolatopsis acidiphila]UIJ61297.1 F0F1 ATP synthase subunit B [Amycolatopsis acidiphila]GHG78366.1 hypothetical protein GCM10017788_45440 [Amycolatopsis acidiphila]
MDAGRYVGTLVAFLLIVGLIWWKIVPPLRRIMREKQETIRRQIEEAKRADERLAEAERTYAEAVAEARKEAAVIRDAARADAHRIGEEMRLRAEQEVERIKQRGEEHLAQQHQQVMRELRIEIGRLSSALAERLVREHLADDANRAATVDGFLDELEQTSARAGEPAVATAGEGAS